MNERLKFITVVSMLSVLIILSAAALWVSSQGKSDETETAPSIKDEITGKWIYDKDNSKFFILFDNGTVYVNDKSSLGNSNISVSKGGIYLMEGSYFLAKGDESKLFNYTLEENKLTLTSERGTVYSYTKSE